MLFQQKKNPPVAGWVLVSSFLRKFGSGGNWFHLSWKGHRFWFDPVLFFAFTVSAASKNGKGYNTAVGRASCAKPNSYFGVGRIEHGFSVWRGM